MAGHAEIKIFDVGREVPGIGNGKGAIDEQFRSGEVGGLGTDIVGVANAVATSGSADASEVHFFGVH